MVVVVATGVLPPGGGCGGVGHWRAICFSLHFERVFLFAVSYCKVRGFISSTLYTLRMKSRHRLGEGFLTLFVLCVLLRVCLRPCMLMLKPAFINYENIVLCVCVCAKQMVTVLFSPSHHCQHKRLAHMCGVVCVLCRWLWTDLGCDTRCWI